MKHSNTQTVPDFKTPPCYTFYYLWNIGLNLTSVSPNLFSTLQQDSPQIDGTIFKDLIGSPLQKNWQLALHDFCPFLFKNLCIFSQQQIMLSPITYCPDKLQTDSIIGNIREISPILVDFIHETPQLNSIQRTLKIHKKLKHRLTMLFIRLRLIPALMIFSTHGNVHLLINNETYYLGKYDTEKELSETKFASFIENNNVLILASFYSVLSFDIEDYGKKSDTKILSLVFNPESINKKEQDFILRCLSENKKSAYTDDDPYENRLIEIIENPYVYILNFTDDPFYAYVWLTTNSLTETTKFQTIYGDSNIKDLPDANKLSKWSESYASCVYFIRLLNELLIYYKENDNKKIGQIVSTMTSLAPNILPFVHKHFRNILLSILSNDKISDNTKKDIGKSLKMLYGSFPNDEIQLSQSDYTFSSYKFDNPIKLLTFLDDKDNNSFVNMLKWNQEFEKQNPISEQFDDFMKETNNFDENTSLHPTSMKISDLPIIP